MPGKETIDQYLPLLQSERHLDRQKALKNVSKELNKDVPKDLLQYLCDYDQQIMQSESWESLQSAFLLATNLLKFPQDQVRIKNNKRHRTRELIKKNRNGLIS